MTEFVTSLCAAAAGRAGMVTGEPGDALRTPWSEVHQAGRRGAARLIADGLTAGDSIAVLAAAPVEVAPAVQSVWLAGGAVTMLHQPTPRTDPAHYARETAQVLAVLGSRTVVLGAQFADFAGRLNAGGIRTRLIAELVADGPAVTEAVAVQEDSPALWQLTSGSTATPKAVRISHANAWNNLTAMRRRAEIVPGGSVMVSWLPLFHDMGMVGFLTLPMVFGVDLVKVTPADFLRNPLLWFELITRYGGTHTAAPNFAYAVAAKALTRAAGLDLSTLRFALNGAEPIDVSAVRQFLAAGARFGLPSHAMVPAYGMAETTLGVSIQQPGEPLVVDELDAVALEQDRLAIPAVPGADRRKFPRLGRPLDDIEIQVRGSTTAVLAERAVGTLFIRGPAVTDRYLTVDGEVPTKGADGWLDTGDIGYLVDGQVVVCGRAKDVIIMGGRNIYPTDIERVATGVEGVRAGNAIAVRWVTSGGRESFVVAVESRLAGGPEAPGIAAGVRSAVTAAIGARPAQVLVLPVGSIPKTPSGKLKRAAARELLAAQLGG